MKLHGMKYARGARQKSCRVGRGHGSGDGETVGKGHKGQRVRSNGGARLGFEGGQIPFARRLPKRGFTNSNRKGYTIVDVAFLNGFEDGTKMTPEPLIECGLVKKELDGIKILDRGELEERLSAKADEFSKSAAATIEQVDGKTGVIWSCLGPLQTRSGIRIFVTEHSLLLPCRSSFASV